MITFNFDGYLSKAHKEELLRGEVQSRKFLLCFVGFGFFTQVGRVPKLQAPVVRNVFCQGVLSVELNTQTAHSHKRYPRLFYFLFLFLSRCSETWCTLCPLQDLSSVKAVCAFYKSPSDEIISRCPLCIHPQKDHLPTLKIVQGASDFGVLWNHYNNPTCTKYALHSGVSPTPVFTLCESTQSYILHQQ